MAWIAVIGSGSESCRRSLGTWLSLLPQPPPRLSDHVDKRLTEIGRHFVRAVRKVMPTELSLAWCAKDASCRICEEVRQPAIWLCRKVHQASAGARMLINKFFARLGEVFMRFSRRY